MKKLLSMLLALAMMLSMTSAMAESAPAGDVRTVIYGSTTEITGDFAPGAWWSNGATDVMLRALSNDYFTVTTDQGGALVVNPTICLLYTSDAADDSVYV